MGCTVQNLYLILIVGSNAGLARCFFDATSGPPGVGLPPVGRPERVVCSPKAAAIPTGGLLGSQ